MEEIKKDLHKLLGFRSVIAEKTQDAPFGEGLKSTLLWFLEKAKAYGLKIKNGDNYYGYCDYGECEDNGIVGVLCHLDTVSAGSGWETEPYSLTERNGFLYGRGIVDNKGPSIIFLHILKKLKEENLRLRKKIRLIVGCNEEAGAECIERYVKNEKIPCFSIVPDADFPVVNSEKGILQIRLFGKIANENISFSFGEALNVVPNSASAVLQNGDSFLTSGISSHSMQPEKGINASWSLFERLSFYSEEVKRIFLLLCNSDAKKNLDIDYSDEKSGNLTISLNKGSLKNGNLELFLDLRLPLCACKDVIMKNIKEKTTFGCEEITYKPNLYFDKNHKLVKTLLSVFGEKNAKPIQTGGGTYARFLPNAIAFGPTFPNTTTDIHNANEKISLQHFQKWYDIYYNAIIKLASS